MKVSANIGFGFMGKAIVQKTENSKSGSSKRRLSIAAFLGAGGLLPSVVGACGGVAMLYRSTIRPSSYRTAVKPTRFRIANTVNTWHLTR